MDIGICGQGRLGGRISTLLTALGHKLLPLRLDRLHGLISPHDEPIQNLRCLILCMVPRHSGPGRAALGWEGMLDGLAGQIRRKELQFDRVVHVSSTRVYDGYGHGWMSADTPALAASDGGRALIAAETQVRHLARDSVVVRLTGLYGPQYERYDPLAMSHEQVRHGVDVRAAAAVVARLVLNGGSGHRSALVTDGHVYYQGRQWLGDQHNGELQDLARQWRLLLPSHVGQWPNAR